MTNIAIFSFINISTFVCTHLLHVCYLLEVKLFYPDVACEYIPVGGTKILYVHQMGLENWPKMFMPDYCLEQAYKTYNFVTILSLSKQYGFYFRTENDLKPSYLYGCLLFLGIP